MSGEQQEWGGTASCQGRSHFVLAPQCSLAAEVLLTGFHFAETPKGK